MNKKALETLEYPKIITRLATYADFSASGDLARQLRPTPNLDVARTRQTATREARHILSLDIFSQCPGYPQPDRVGPTGWRSGTCRPAGNQEHVNCFPHSQTHHGKHGV